jgi:U-box domain/Sel1 repeat
MSDDDFDDMPFQALRSRCRMANLCAKGDKPTLCKRLREHSTLRTSPERILDLTNGGAKKRVGGSATVRKDYADDHDDDTVVGKGSSNKRQKKSPGDDLICPITLALPWDPVFAEDGRLYEREAIEKHFQTHCECQGHKSPMTRQPMGSRLLPAPQIRNLIETLIENGSIQGDLVVTWKKHVEIHKHMKAILKQANEGDNEAMYRVARYYEEGYGCRKDRKLAFLWFRKGHAAGSVKATCGLGICHLIGSGVRKNCAQGLAFLSLAAAQDSDYAACELGSAFFRGKWGLEKNDEEAIYWLRKSLGNCRHQHCADSVRKLAQERLDTLLEDDAPHDEPERKE